MTILVSGSSGWLGQALSANLLIQGISWRAISRQLIESAAPLLADPKYAQASCAIHLAGLAHAQGSHQDIGLYMQANCTHAVNFAKLCQRHGVRRFVFVSTAKIIGDATAAPANEAQAPRPNDPYALSKLAAEKALLELHTPGQFDVVIVRPPLVYGEHVRANFLQLLKLADSSLPLPLLSNTQRSMIYIGNLVSALNHARTAPQLPGKAWFVKDENDYRLTDLIAHLREQFNRPQRLLAIPGRLPSVITSIAKGLPLIGEKILRMSDSLQIDDSAFRATKWQAPFEDWMGIDNTAQWYQRHRGLAQ